MITLYFFFYSAKNGDPNFIFSLVDCCSSVTRTCPTVCNPMDHSTAHQTSLSFTISQSLLKLMSIELVMPSNHLFLSRPLLLLPSIFPSIRIFSNESDLCIRWSKYWNFSFSISLSNGYSGLIFFRIDGFAFLAVQGTLQESYLAPHFKTREVLKLQV